MEQKEAEETGKLSAEQIANWRKALMITFGPWALIMPDEQIQALHDRLQAQLDKKGD